MESQVSGAVSIGNGISSVVTSLALAILYNSHNHHHHTLYVAPTTMLHEQGDTDNSSVSSTSC